MYIPILLSVLVTLCSSICHQPSLPKEPYPIYKRREVPLSNKISVMSTPRTILFPEHFFRNVPQVEEHRQPYFKGIQYAPLHTAFQAPTRVTKTSDDVKQNIENKTNNVSSGQKVYSKEHLEPRPQTSQENPNFKCNPGQNIKVLTSVSRSPGHNAVYRTFPKIVPRDKSFKTSKHSYDGNQIEVDMQIQDDVAEIMAHKKQAVKKINYMRPYAVYHLDAGTTVPPAGSERPSDKGYQQYLLNHYLADQDLLSDASKSKLQPYSPYNKFHRLHLNIARVYSPGQVPPKSEECDKTRPSKSSAAKVPNLMPGVSYPRLPSHEKQGKYHFR